jgi:hypothetical protein
MVRPGTDGMGGVAPLSPLCTVTERIAAGHPAGTAGPADGPMAGQRLTTGPPRGRTNDTIANGAPVMA